ncbi:MAG: putative quinol monooxygenase [Vicinamibacteria bacterium]
MPGTPARRPRPRPGEARGEEASVRASEANAAASRREPGVVRFDLLADRDDPAHFVLVEVYRDAAAAAAHKETPHYAARRDAVAGLMAEPRAERHVNVSPGDDGF